MGKLEVWVDLRDGRLGLELPDSGVQSYRPRRMKMNPNARLLGTVGVQNLNRVVEFGLQPDTKTDPVKATGEKNLHELREDVLRVAALYMAAEKEDETHAHYDAQLELYEEELNRAVKAYTLARAYGVGE